VTLPQNPITTNLDRLPPENEESFSALSQESREFVDQNVFDFVGLLDLDAHSDAVDAGLNVHFLVVIPSNYQGIEQGLW
jgi:hypothetical protein